MAIKAKPYTAAKTPPRCSKHPGYAMVYSPEKGAWKCTSPDCRIVKYPKAEASARNPILGTGKLQLIYDSKAKKVYIKSDNNVLMDITKVYEGKIPDHDFSAQANGMIVTLQFHDWTVFNGAPASKESDDSPPWND